MSSNNNKFGSNNNNSNKFGSNNNNSNKFGSNNNNSNKFGNNKPSGSNNNNKPKTNNQVTSFSSKSTSTPASSSSNRNTQRAAVGGGATVAGANVLEDLLARIIGLQVPVVQPEILQLAMGLLNCFFFGVGVIVCGALNNDLIDVVIGILQLVIPFVGWVWAIVWGIIMILVLLNNKK